MLNDKVLYKNMKYLKGEGKNLGNEIKESYNYTRDYTVSIVDSCASLSRNGMVCYANSQYDLEEEAKRILTRVDDETNILILFGFGMANCAQYLIDHKEKYTSLEDVIVIEPVPEVFEASLKIFNLEEFINSFTHVEFMIGNDYYKTVSKLHEILIRRTGKKIELAFSIPYRTVFSDYYDFMMEWVVKLLQIWRMNIDTTDYFKVHWLNNCLSNVIKSNLPLSILDGYFKDRPVLLVAAGPSLNEMIPYIKNNSEKFYIVAVGSAIGILNKNDIVPDFYFAIDASPEQMIIFENISQKPILVYADTLFHQVVSDYTGRKLLMFIEGDLISNYILKELEINLKFTPGVCSVAIYALNALLAMGFTSIFFIGQDLAYSEGQLYSEGAWSKAGVELLSEKRRMISAVDKNGNEVYTDNAFLKMKTAIEHIALDKENERCSFYNLGKTGLAINGVTDMTYIDLQNAANIQIDKELERNKMDLMFEQLEHRGHKEFFIKEIAKINQTVADIVACAHNYLNFLENEKLSEEILKIELEKYSNFVDSKSIYKEVIERMLVPVFYSIDEAYKEDTFAKRQKFKVAESMRVCLAIFKITEDLLKTSREDSCG